MWLFSRRRRIALVEGHPRRPLPLNHLSVLSLTGLGIWTLSSSKPIKAESPSPADLPEDESPIALQQARRSAPYKSSNYSTNEPNHLIPGQQVPPPQSKISDKEENDGTVSLDS